METPDQIKKGLEHCINGASCRGCPYCEECATASDCNPLHKDLQEYIQQLESQVPRWISVEERLPEELKDVLVYRDGCFAIARIITGDDWTYCGMGGDPTHWMPLPEPPEEE